MRYYTIQDNSILTADTEQALSRFYTNVYELPEDYEEGKYIIGEKEIEIEVVDPETGETHIEIITIQTLVPNPNWEQEQTEAREREFKNQFFEVTGYGWYRRIPKGYSSAVESMNTLFNVASIAQGIQAGLIIFYPQPDFTIAEQCTEEWLIEHQIIMPAMTAQEFMQLYVVFMTAWNTQEHVNEEAENV